MSVANYTAIKMLQGKNAIQEQLVGVLMGKSKKDLGKQVQNMKHRIIELEKLARMDPLHRHPEVHEELDKLKKKLAEQ